VRQILEHVMVSEVWYGRAIEALRGRDQVSTAAVNSSIGSLDHATRELEESRSALLDAVEGVDEESFYRLGRVPWQGWQGLQDYSVLSVLEAVVDHDREHADQIRETVALKA